mgnify:CR=1 FL=1
MVTWRCSASPRKTVSVVVASLALFGLLFPFEMEILPPFSFQVVDSNGVPIGGMSVRYYWAHYSIDAEGGREHHVSAADGTVALSAKSVRACLLARWLVPLHDAYARATIHGSTGILGQIVVVDPTWYYDSASFAVEPGKPIPTQLVLRPLSEGRRSER